MPTLDVTARRAHARPALRARPPGLRAEVEMPTEYICHYWLYYGCDWLVACSLTRHARCNHLLIGCLDRSFSQADGMQKEALGLARGECWKWPFPAGLVGTEQALEHGPR
jgi:hypothetical protein